jgi:AcrR family transcriptional regulator
MSGAGGDPGVPARPSAGGRAGATLRADAALNRRRLIDSARAALAAADDIDDVTMHGVARAAGVGQATIYRHFPTREDLLLAVYHVDVERLVATAPELLERYAPREALRHWLDQVAAYGRIKQGLAQVVHAATREAIRSQWRPPVLDALSQLLDAAQQAGQIRPDVDADDLWRLCAFLWSREVADDWQTRTKHLLDLVFDGLRPLRRCLRRPGRAGR